PGVGDANAGPLTLHYLGGEKEILDLFFGKSRLIRGPDNTWANQTEQRCCRQLRPLPMKDVHRSPSPNYAHRAYSLNRRPATQNYSRWLPASNFPQVRFSRLGTVANSRASGLKSNYCLGSSPLDFRGSSSRLRRRFLEA